MPQKIRNGNSKTKNKKQPDRRLLSNTPRPDAMLPLLRIFGYRKARSSQTPQYSPEPRTQESKNSQQKWVQNQQLTRTIFLRKNYKQHTWEIGLAAQQSSIQLPAFDPSLKINSRQQKRFFKLSKSSILTLTVPILLLKNSEAYIKARRILIASRQTFKELLPNQIYLRES